MDLCLFAPNHGISDSYLLYRIQKCQLPQSSDASTPLGLCIPVQPHPMQKALISFRDLNMEGEFRLKVRHNFKEHSMIGVLFKDKGHPLQKCLPVAKKKGGTVTIQPLLTNHPFISEHTTPKAKELSGLFNCFQNSSLVLTT